MQLLKNSKKILARTQGKTLIFLLDYDGTLTPIVKKPGLARLSKRGKNILRRLCKKFIVGIISGRKLDDVMRRVGIKRIFYVGNHGFEICGPSTKVTFGAAKLPRRSAAVLVKKLKNKVSDIKGIFIEDKGITFSLHYRPAKHNDYLKARKVFFQIIKPYILKRKVRITYGKKVIEVRPNIAWDKGKASSWIVKMLKKKYDLAKVVPVYIGDDVTDEDAFRALKASGITVLVGKRKTKAEFTVKNVPEVYKFLKKFINN